MATATSPWATRRVLHDLAGHLRAVKGSLELVPDAERARLGTRPRHALALADESLEAALGLLRETSEHQDLAEIAVARAIDTHAVAKSVARELVPVYPHARIEVSHIPRALADEVALRRVLLNLVANACTHGGAAPRVRIAGALEQAERPHVRISVADDGPGIDPRDHLLLFLPKPDSAPHGHGLPNALHLVAELRGRLWIESGAGRGTAIHFTLPAA